MPIQYYMRAFKITPTTGYVDWIVNDHPDTTGVFSGYDPSELINITVNRAVQSKVENFLKPTETRDGYFFHINSYDWIHPPTPPFDTPIPLPPNIAGIAVVRGSLDGITPRDHATLHWDETIAAWKFAYNTNGDGYTIGASLPVHFGSSSIDGYLSIGTNPAQSGIIRIPNLEAIKARNSDNTGDVYIAQVNANNQVQIGSPSDPVYIPDWLRLDGYLVNNDPSLASTTGFIRNPNNTSIITFRDSTNSSNISALASSLNSIKIGDNNVEGISYNTADGYYHSFQSSGSSNVEIGSNFIRFTSDVEYPSIYQSTRSIGNGQNLTIQAQSTTDFAEYGGSVVLSSGTGVLGDGYVDVRTNNDVKIRVFGNNAPVTPDLPDNSSLNLDSVLFNVPSLRFYDQISNPIISQDPINSFGGIGQTLKISSQNSTGFSGTGGNLDLTSGSGTFSSGTVNIQTGGSTRLQVNPTTTTSFNSLVTFASSVANPTINQSTIGSGTGQDLTIQAQDVAGTGVGGNLILKSGDSTTFGNVQVKVGDYDAWTFDGYSYKSISYLRGIEFDGYVTSPYISQADNNDVSVIAESLRIQAQNAPYGSGGDLMLSAGSGFDANGKIQLQVGLTTFANAGIDGFGNSYIDIGTSPATEGLIRAPNDLWILEARNNANTDNLKVIGTNSLDQILLGDNLSTIIVDGQMNITGDIDIPGGDIIAANNFSISGVHVQGTVTADALNILTNGSNADGYHTHSGMIASAQNSKIVGVMGKLTANTDGYLLTSFCESSDENCPAFIVTKTSGLITKLVVTSDVKPSLGESVQIIIRKNKVDTVLTATLDNSAAANTVGYIVHNSINTVSVVFGDWITFRFISSSGAVVTNLVASVEC